MRVTVVWASATLQDVVAVNLPAGATVADAVARSGLVVRYDLDPAALGYAIFGRRTSGDAPLGDGDRVDLTRALAADPKERRRWRAREKQAAARPVSVRREAKR